VLRDRLACLTRKTHAFAKRELTWDAAVALCLFEHNWMRPCGRYESVSPTLRPDAATVSAPLRATGALRSVRVP
jgi:hypothetical protein